jgi:hypothetical protein
MSSLRLLEAAAWITGALLFGAILLDSWRTNRTYDESLLLSSREGEIEQDLREVAKDLEQLEDRVDELSGRHS